MSGLEQFGCAGVHRRKSDGYDRSKRYGLKAQKYEEQAKLVSDAWVKERLRVRARHWREAAEQEEGGSSGESRDRTA
jgi:hypothetical protein